MSHYQLRRGDQVSIYFKTETSAPYHAPYQMHGTYKDESDEYIRIEGTVGEHIGKDIFIPKSEVKMIERIAERKSEGE
jgi:hypothetical protein